MGLTYQATDGEHRPLVGDGDDPLVNYEGSSISPGANLEGQNLADAFMPSASLVRVNLSRADLSGALLDDASLFQVIARHADFSVTNMEDSILTMGDFCGSSFVSACLAGSSITEANLQRAYFGKTDLSHVNLTASDLCSADIREANLCSANLSRVNLERACLYRVDFSGAILWTTNFNNANFHESYYFAGRPPAAPEEIIAELYEVEEGFEWPSTEVGAGEPSDSALLDTKNWPQVGMLKHFGYTVGKTSGLPTENRRKILAEVFVAKQLPELEYEGYREEWGEANSPQRLQKMAESIAAFVRSQKKRHIPAREAIEDWESDLSYLFEAYYRGRFDFYWPTTDE